MKPMTKLKKDIHSQIPWTAAREAKCLRDSGGRFHRWIGGSKKTTKSGSYQGAAIHHGKEFAKQHGRPARVGEVVRTQKNDGTYHTTARWYCKTDHGWREVGTTAKPSKKQILLVMHQARKGK